MLTKKGGRGMKILKISDSQGYFLGEGQEYAPIDKITKDDLLRLVDLTLEEDVSFDEFSEETLRNQAHQIIYRSIFQKLEELEKRKNEHKDESDRLFLNEYQRYSPETS